MPFSVIRDVRAGDKDALLPLVSAAAFVHQVLECGAHPVPRGARVPFVSTFVARPELGAPPEVLVQLQDLQSLPEFSSLVTQLARLRVQTSGAAMTTFWESSPGTGTTGTLPVRALRACLDVLRSAHVAAALAFVFPDAPDATLKASRLASAGYVMRGECVVSRAFVKSFHCAHSELISELNSAHVWECSIALRPPPFSPVDTVPRPAPRLASRPAPRLAPRPAPRLRSVALVLPRSNRLNRSRPGPPRRVRRALPLRSETDTDNEEEEKDADEDAEDEDSLSDSASDSNAGFDIEPDWRPHGNGSGHGPGRGVLAMAPAEPAGVASRGLSVPWAEEARAETDGMETGMLRELVDDDKTVLARICAEDVVQALQPEAHEAAFVDLILDWGQRGLDVVPGAYTAVGAVEHGKLVGFVGLFHVIGKAAMGGRSEWPAPSLAARLRRLGVPTHTAKTDAEKELGSGANDAQPLSSCVVSWAFLSRTSESMRVRAVNQFVAHFQAILPRIIVLMPCGAATPSDTAVIRSLGLESAGVVHVPQDWLPLGRVDVWTRALGPLQGSAQAPSQGPSLDLGLGESRKRRRNSATGAPAESAGAFIPTKRRDRAFRRRQNKQRKREKRAKLERQQQQQQRDALLLLHLSATSDATEATASEASNGVVADATRAMASDAEDDDKVSLSSWSTSCSSQFFTEHVSTHAWKRGRVQFCVRFSPPRTPGKRWRVNPSWQSAVNLPGNVHLREYLRRLRKLDATEFRRVRVAVAKQQAAASTEAVAAEVEAEREAEMKAE